jgi:aspartate-semialdehyde dehydrogenase
VSAQRSWRVALIGATGAVGEELLGVLEDRRFPVSELRAFATDDSEGRSVDFRGESVPVESVEPERVAQEEILFCAAPGVLDGLLPALEESGTRVIDLSGALELDPDIPLYLPDGDLGRMPVQRVAIPRGIVAGLALALRPLQSEVALERLSVVTLESASGAGRRGVGELADQTLEILNSMTGDAGGAEVFPQPMAFDCLPLVGIPLEPGDTGEEHRLAHVLRRLLGQPALPVEVTRVRVPIFGGSLACVHASQAEALSVERVGELWAKAPGLRGVGPDGIPTPRTQTGRDDVAVGRIRALAESTPGLAFVVAMDDLRRGAAVSAVEAAEILIG